MAHHSNPLGRVVWPFFEAPHSVSGASEATRRVVLAFILATNPSLISVLHPAEQLLWVNLLRIVGYNSTV